MSEPLDPIWRPLAERFAQVLGCDVSDRIAVPKRVPDVWIVGARPHSPRGVAGCAFGDESIHCWLAEDGTYHAARYRSSGVAFLTATGWASRPTVKVGADDFAADDLRTLCRLDAAADGFLLAALTREGEAEVVAAMARTRP